MHQKGLRSQQHRISAIKSRSSALIQCKCSLYSQPYINAVLAWSLFQCDFYWLAHLLLHYSKCYKH